MGNQALNWAWQLELPVTTKFVLIALCDQASDTTNSCFPGQERIATMIGGSQKTVERALKDLEKLGLIERSQRRTKQGWRTSDLYLVKVGQTVLPDSEPTRQTAYQTESLVGNLSKPTRLSVQSLPDSLSGQEELRSSEPLDVNPQGEPPDLWPMHLIDAAPTDDELFEAWWATIRRKVGKPKARTAYLAALRKIGTPRNTAHATLLAAIQEHQRHWFDLAGRSIDKTPHPTTWLNAESWNDELPEDSAYQSRNNGRESSLDRLARQRQQAFADLETLNNNQKAIGR